VKSDGFSLIPCVPLDVREENARASVGIEEFRSSGHLAVVGSGRSIASHIAELQSWDGDVWAVNATWGWCETHGIRAYAYSVDPLPELEAFIIGARAAVLADHCDPKAFAAVKRVYRLTGPHEGPTSANAADLAAIKAGYSSVTYFGCESSFGETTHAYRNDAVPDLIRVECGGESFLTKIEYMKQAKGLADTIRAFPHVFSERSGGLLSAMVKHGDCEVTHISRGLLAA